MWGSGSSVGSESATGWWTRGRRFDRSGQRSFAVRGIALSATPALAFIANLVLVHVAAALAVWRSPDRDPLRPAMSGAGRYLVAPLTLWDGGWYERIARSGYAGRPETAAFWPLYPWIVGTASRVTGLSIAVTGIAVSQLSFAAALFVLHQYVAAAYGAEAARRVIWLVALCPVSFFFSAMYTESLFLLLSVAAVALARNSQWTGAALALFLAALT